jgi:spore germination protein KB
MKNQPGKLGIREYTAIAIFVVGSKLTDDTIALIYEPLQNASWMLPIVSGGIFYIPLFLLLKTLSLYQNKDLFTVIQQLLGKYIGFLVCLLIFVISSTAISFDSRAYVNIIRSFYFTTTPTVIIYAILMSVCAYGARKGIQHIGSISWMLIFYSIVSIILALVLCLKDSTFQSLFPIWGTGKLEIVKQSSLKTTLFADFFLFTLLIPYITSMKDFRKGTWISYVFSMIIISGAFMIYIILFDKSVAGLGYPFHTAIRYITIGTFLTNVETIFFPIWLTVALIRYSAFLYLCALMFGHLLKIKDFKFLIPSLATLYLLIGIIPDTPFEVTLVIRSKVVNGTGLTFAAISMIVWLTAWLKGEFRHEKNKNSM